MSKKLYITLIGIFSAVFLFAAIRLVQINLEYAEGERIYDESEDEFVKTAAETTVPTVSSAVSTRPLTSVPPPSVPSSSVPSAPSSSPPDTTSAPETVPDPPPDDSGPGVEVDFAALKEVNEDIIGWILIKDTNISFPLLKGVDNDMYLNTTYDKQASRFGSIFVDMYNEYDFSDRHTIIYGHNMKGGMMFGSLRYFGGQDYYEEHPYVYIITETGYLKYRIFSAHTTETDEGVFVRKFEDNTGYRNFLNLVHRSSWITWQDAATTDDQVITLATCTAPSNPEERFVVHALLEEDTRAE